MHLLGNCPGTAPYRLSHGISFDTLAEECPKNIYRIASFDAFIRHCLKCDYIRTQSSLDAAISEYKRKYDGSSDDNNNQQNSQDRKHKRQKLIIQHQGLPHCGIKRQRHNIEEQTQYAVTKRHLKS